MPRSENQKLKLLYLMKILLNQTDENHALSVAQMVSELAACGIRAERKSIYDDLEALRGFGLDIVRQKTKTTGYFVAGRTFELPELKLLADAVASSKFITAKKSGELIKKIESLTSTYEARQLQRQVYVIGRVKTINEHIYYNVDVIHRAIAENRQIGFRYFEYAVAPQEPARWKKQYRYGGGRYTASPYALSWDDENYYMIAYYERHGNLSHFRVDKMEDIEMREEARHSLPEGMAFDPAAYSKKVFNMFGGEEEKIQLRFDNSLIGVVLDRFGKDVAVCPDGADGFVIRVNALVSPTLLGWIFGFGGKVRILGPQSLIQAFRKQAEENLLRYGCRP